MENVKELNDLKDCILKLDTAMRILMDGKEIPCYNKLLGIRQKLGIMYGDKCKKNGEDAALLNMAPEDNNENDKNGTV